MRAGSSLPSSASCPSTLGAHWPGRIGDPEAGTLQGGPGEPCNHRGLHGTGHRVHTGLGVKRTGCSEKLQKQTAEQSSGGTDAREGAIPLGRSLRKDGGGTGRCQVTRTGLARANTQVGKNGHLQGSERGQACLEGGALGVNTTAKPAQLWRPVCRGEGLGLTQQAVGSHRRALRGGGT